MMRLTTNYVEKQIERINNDLVKMGVIGGGLWLEKIPNTSYYALIDRITHVYVVQGTLSEVYNALMGMQYITSKIII